MTCLHYPNLTSENEILYQLEGIGKDFLGNVEMITVLDNVNLTIKKGETISIVGASGSGKSSFLQILGGLVSPSRGKIFFKGKDFGQTTVDEKATLRNKFIGFVFQFHYLLPEFTTLENIAIPAMISGISRKKALEEALVVLEQVGLAERKNFNVTLLSGGERQRVAIARALLCKPLVLLADEPTGNLDQQNSHMIADLLLRLNEVYKMSIVMVTHNHELATRMGRCFELKSGDLYDQTC